MRWPDALSNYFTKDEGKEGWKERAKGMRGKGLVAGISLRVGSADSMVNILYERRDFFMNLEEFNHISREIWDVLSHLHP